MELSNMAWWMDGFLLLKRCSSTPKTFLHTYNDKGVILNLTEQTRILNINNESIHRRTACYSSFSVLTHSCHCEMILTTYTCAQDVCFEKYFHSHWTCLGAFGTVALVFSEQQGSPKRKFSLIQMPTDEKKKKKRKASGRSICLPARFSSLGQTKHTWRIYLNLHRKSSWAPDTARQDLLHRMRRKFAC